MLPNSLASTGPYAGLWSHLKSMEHALSRVLEGKKREPLDRDRFSALIEFLQSGVASASSASGSGTAGLVSLARQAANEYLPTVDVRAEIESVPEFQTWKKSMRKSSDDLIQRVISAVKETLIANDLFTLSDPQREEFEILRELLRKLLSEAEADL